MPLDSPICIKVFVITIALWSTNGKQIKNGKIFLKAVDRRKGEGRKEGRRRKAPEKVVVYCNDRQEFRILSDGFHF